MIHDLRLVDFTYPELTLEVCCGSGTYIRSVGRDIAGRLGTHAVMSALTRTAIGPFTLDAAISADTLRAENLESALLPPARAVADLPCICLDERELEAVAHGRKILVRDRRQKVDQAREVACVNQQGELVAVLERRAAGFLQPKRNFIGR